MREREKRDSRRKKGRGEDAEEEDGEVRKKLTCDGKLSSHARKRKKERTREILEK